MMRRPAILLAVLLSCATNAVEIIAHRGASHDAPENTLAAFKLALEQNCDVIELDIYLSKDDKVVVIHDSDTKRVAKVEKKVREQTAAELQALDVGSFKGKQFAGEKIPLLSEVLPLVPSGKRVFIEIKCGPEVIPELDKVLGACPLKPEQLVVICFSEGTLRKAKEKWPNLKMYWLQAMKQNETTKSWTPALESLIEKCKAAGLDGLNLKFCDALDAAAVDKVKAAQLKLYVWTLNTKPELEKAITVGVDGIGTDRPGLLHSLLK